MILNEGRSFLLCAKPVFSSASGRVLEFMVVLIGLVIIFKEQITKLLENIFKEVNSQSKEVY